MFLAVTVEAGEATGIHVVAVGNHAAKWPKASFNTLASMCICFALWLLKGAHLVLERQFKLQYKLGNNTVQSEMFILPEMNKQAAHRKGK